MIGTAAAELTPIHSKLEISNFEATTKTVDDWIHSEWPSSFVIPQLHLELLQGIKDYSNKGIVPRNPGESRKEDIKVSGEPENFYVRGADVDPILRDYFTSLDKRLADLPTEAPGNIDTIVQNASWAYYVFERIHPYLDCNGRTGRLILNRIVQGAGLDSIIFLDSWFEQERENHLDAMNLVDQTGDLSALELYILNALKSNPRNKSLGQEIDNLISTKEKALLSKRQLKGIENIWEKFSDIDIANPNQMVREQQSFSAA